jgi:hypothetical protein
MRRVSWAIDVTADNAKEAAEKALAIQRDPDSLATVFDVQGRDGKTVRVDLSAGVMDEQQVRCPRCGQGRLAQVDSLLGHAVIEAIRTDGTIVWAGETRMDWDSQRPAHFPPQIVCLACNHQMTLRGMIAAQHRLNRECNQGKEQKAS